MRAHTLFAALILMLILAACGSKAARTYEAPATEAPALEFAQPAVESGAGAPAAAAPAPTAAIYQTGPEPATGNTLFVDRKVIKNADVRLLVRDTDVAVDGITQMVDDVSGYIISSRVWYQDYYGENYKYATITIGVPVDQFENALRRLRGLAVRVLDEQASGQDVTDQYVDLESRLRNLEATRDRIKSFLDQAKTVDEALRINQQLSEIEAQIEDIKGKMNYLSDRSAFSTFTVNLEPDLPPVVATPTPTPTPVPVQPLGPWEPSRTFQKAENALVSAYRVVIDLLIWILVVLLPIFGPPVLVIWLIWRLFQRKSSKPAEKA